MRVNLQQQVRVKSKNSHFKPVLSGIPQGSILAVLLSSCLGLGIEASRDWHYLVFTLGLGLAGCGLGLGLGLAISKSWFWSWNGMMIFD